jgi:hypothetical protein
VARITALIFAKYPDPGAVNTRMVGPLTAIEAAAVHEASLLAVCELVGGVDELEPILVVTPDDRAAELRAVVEGRRVPCLHGHSPGKRARPSTCSPDFCGTGFQPVKQTGYKPVPHYTDCWPQGEGGLGQRLTRAMDRAFGLGAKGVLLLGADSPTLPTGFLNRAVASLVEHDAVLGPCEDGGYYLLGIRRRLPMLFERIDWGSAHVADQTRQRAAEAGIDLHALPSWYDLDRFDDLKRAARDLAETADESQPAAVALRSLIDTYAYPGR